MPPENGFLNLAIQESSKKNVHIKQKIRTLQRLFTFDKSPVYRLLVFWLVTITWCYECFVGL